MNKIGGSRPPEILSTHPNPEKRIAGLNQYMADALKYYTASTVAH
jgi:predicted Zn-dependent protease